MPTVTVEGTYHDLGVGPKDDMVKSHTSGFTAVNGRSPPSPENGQMNGIARHNHTSPRDSSSSRSPDEMHSPRNHRDDWRSATTNGDRSSRVTPPETFKKSSPNGLGKRRRSRSDEERDPPRETWAEHIASINRERRHPDKLDYEPNRLPQDSSDQARQQDTTSGAERSANNRPHYSPNPRDTDEPWPTRQRTEVSRADARFEEAFHRESQNVDLQPRMSSDGASGDRSMGMPRSQSEFGSTEMTHGGIQADPKRRKRVFSHRTKTGCQTCRRRKKKCDEARPHCQNCERGGFPCEGYGIKSTWTKPSLQKGPIPLQAKDGFADQPGVYQSVHQAPEHYGEFKPFQSADGGRDRPIIDEGEPGHPKRKSAWGNSSDSPWADPPQRSHNSDRTPLNEYPLQRPPENPKLQAQDAATLTPHHAHSQPSHNHSVSSNHAYAETTTDRNLAGSINSSQSAATAQLALQQQYPMPPLAPQQQQKPGPAPGPTEKEKMLSEQPYLPFCPQLVEEREQCKAALWRFNNANNPAIGVSREERARLFRAILKPAHVQPATASSKNPTNSLGRGINVEAPFTCEYGYNISIGDEVIIGPGCTILDPCRVVIGDRTVLGPNVNIYGNTISTDPRSRKGSQGPAIGRSVIIDEDVFVGGGTTILPGRRVGKCSTIGAGSVVTRDVPPYTVVAGNPATVKRGIWIDRRN